MSRSRKFNWLVSDTIRATLQYWMQWSARLRGQRFYCRALAGLSDYNICINCDSTVSCTCMDFDGKGRLGDLKTHSFAEVFFGPVASRFREDLSQGRLPIRTCVRCIELRRVSKDSAKASESNGASGAFASPEPRLPFRGMMLENTIHCNHRCLGCGREEAAAKRSTRQMGLEQVTQMADLARELKLETLYYLNLGEPFLSRNIGQELSVLRERNPNCRIIISSNGAVLDTDAKREAALKASHIYFSVAGINDDMVYKYQRERTFEKSYRNMKALAEYRNARGLLEPELEWKYLLFNWNDQPRTIQRAIELAKAAGLDLISFWPTHNPVHGMSWRYHLGGLNSIGVKTWKGREVKFGPNTRA